MDTYNFLKTVLPQVGLYCLALLKPETGGFEHYTFSTVEELSAAAAQWNQYQRNVFFTLGTLEQPYVMEQQADGSTRKRYRKHENIYAVRSFWLDADVGANNPDKYNTREEALNAIWGFVKQCRLPHPIITSSGNGYHAYFPFNRDVTGNDWQLIADRVKSLAAHLGFRFDPARTSDRSSVLRVPGSHNWKDPTNPKLCEVVNAKAQVCNPAVLVQHLESLVAEYDAKRIERPQPRERKEKHDHIWGRPQVDYQPVLTNCAQMHLVASCRGNVREPLWYKALQVCRHMSRGYDIAHFISSGHPNYSKDETDRKLMILEQKDVGPATCDSFYSENPSGCLGCKHRGKLNSPINVARLVAAPPPKVVAPVAQAQPAPQVSPAVQSVPNPTAAVVVPAVAAAAPASPAPSVEPEDDDLPEAPWPFMRSASGEVVMEEEDAEGNTGFTAILPYDMYPTRIEVEPVSRCTVMWVRAMLPRGRVAEFYIPAAHLQDKKQFLKTLADNGVVPAISKGQHVMTYLNAYYGALQQHRDSSIMYSQMGWCDEGFVLGNKVYGAGGNSKPVSLNEQATSLAKEMQPAGTYAEWREAFNAYSKKPGYEAFIFAALCGFASPLVPFTSVKGVIYNMVSSVSGVGKSVSEKLCNSVWGNSSEEVLLRQDSTKSKFTKIALRGNLPVTHDEITNIDRDEVSEFVYNVTQGRAHDRLNVDSTLRHNTNKWSTILVSSANSSLIDKLSAAKGNAQAEMARIFEVTLAPNPQGFTPAEADRLIVDPIRNNYGHAGPIFAAFLAANRHILPEYIRKIENDLYARIEGKSSERYWVALVACVYVGGAIAKKLGLHDYDMNAIYQWGIKQILSHRVVVKDTVQTPVEVLTSFLSDNVRNTVVVANIGGFVTDKTAQLSKACVRIDTEENRMWVTVESLRAYCANKGYNYNDTVKTLEADGIVLDRSVRKSITAGTDLRTPSVRTILVDVKHPIFGNVVAQLVTSDANAKATA